MMPEEYSEKEMSKEEALLKKILKSKYAKARELGIDTVRKLAAYTPIQLLSLGLYDDLDSASRVIREARMRIGIDVVITKQKREQYLKLPKLTTCVKAIDELLGGGLWPGKIYGVYGEEGSGKSRLAHQLLVTVQLKPIEGKAIYMDSENVYNQDLIARTAERFGLDPDTVLENIIVVDSSDYFALEEFLRREWPDYLEQGYKLLVIDTLVGPYREAFTGRAHLAERQQRINATLNWIRRRISFYKTYCLITDQVQAVPDPSKRIDKTFIGGYVLGHGVTEWYYIFKTGSATRRLIAYDVIHRRTGESVEFKITDYGIEDVTTD